MGMKRKSAKPKRSTWRGWAIADAEGRLVLGRDGAPFPYRYRRDAMLDRPDEGDTVVRVVMSVEKPRR